MAQIYGTLGLGNATVSKATEMASCYFENDGKGGFTKHHLPLEAQYGPLMSIQIHDVDSDGRQDLICAGGIYNAENETTRYDAGLGTVLFNQGEGRFKEEFDYSAFLPYDIKDMVLMKEEWEACFDCH